MMSHIQLDKEEEKELVEGESMEEKNITWVKRKNWLEMCYKHFRMWLLYSKVILFQEGLLIFIYV